MVRYAVLGLLRERADYGYQLKRRFDEQIGSLWNLNIGQVYQTLRSLKRLGLVAELPERQRGRHAERCVFEVTAKGERTLDRWLERPATRPRPLRDDILIRLLVRDKTQTDGMCRRVAEEEHLYQRHLRRLVAKRRSLLGNSHGETPSLALLGVEGAILHAEAHLKWLAFCRQGLFEDCQPEAAPAEAEQLIAHH